MLREEIKKSFLTGYKILQQFVENDENFIKIEKTCEMIVESIRNGGKPIICGNGGSLTDAMHFAEELTGRFRGDRKALPAISISDPSHITCAGNDYGFNEIFARGVEAYGQKDDVFIGISTSGNSENVIRAFKKAKDLGLKTVAILGKNGGKIKGTTDIEFIIPGETSDRIQEIHMFILHTIIEGIERIVFPENY